MLGYLSANAQVNVWKKAGIVNNLIDNFGFDHISFWNKGEEYSNNIHSDSDVMIFHLGNINNSPVISDEFVAFIGKGQFSELERAYSTKDFFFTDNLNNFYLYEHHTINDYNDWKNMYGKVWIRKAEKKDIFDLLAEHMQVNISNNLLLLCE